MSYRPTISIYYDNKLVDIQFYLNWDERSLLFEAAVLYALYRDCKTAKAYLTKRYGTDNTSYLLAPEILDNGEDSLTFLEECSEIPLVLDMTNECLYCLGNFKGPDVVGPVSIHTDFFYLLRDHNISLKNVNVPELLTYARVEDMPVEPTEKAIIPMGV